MKRFAASAFVLAFVSLTAHAQSLPVDPDARLSLGVNVGYTASAYKTDKTVGFAPQGFYDNNRWYIEGGELGFYPYKDSKHHARIGVGYDGRSFDPDDADDEIKGLDKRKASILAHASYMHITPIGGFKAKVATDVGGRHDGTAVTLSHVSRFNVDKFTIYPSFGATWRDKNYNNYYYGVTERESARTGVQAYQADDGISPFISAMVNYDMNDNIALFANQRFVWLSSAQKDSPMTEGSVESTTRLGVNYKF